MAGLSENTDYKKEIVRCTMIKADQQSWLAVVALAGWRPRFCPPGNCTMLIFGHPIDQVLDQV